MTPATTFVVHNIQTVEEHPTLMLRFQNGRLQQKWLLVDYQGGFPIGQREEWRDVPTVTEGTE